jgi:ABC-2 type transport system ATP-binding protein
MAPMSKMIELKSLVKRYGKITAVNDVSLAIPRGTCFGLLGPNGAGKTTLIEIIEKIIPQDSGEVLYKGKPRGPSFREEVGIMFQETGLLSFLSVEETLATFGELYDTPDDIETLIQKCHLSEIRRQMNNKISGGQRQRLLLALALVNRPKLLFLDEPSTGLDPQARRNLWDLVGDIRKDGKSIVLTTHYMEEAEYLCDEVAIMDSGRIIAQGTPHELITSHCKGATLSLPLGEIEQDLDRLNIPYHRNGDSVEIETENIQESIQVLIDGGVGLTNLNVRTPNLETVFLNLTGRHLRE